MVRWLAPLAIAACSTSPPSGGQDTAWITGPTITDSAGDAPRLDPGVATLGTQVVVAGGIVAGAATANVEVLETTTLTWSSPFHPLPDAWSDLQLAGSGTTLFALGGLASGVPQGLAYKLETGEPAPSWTPIASLPAGLERGAAAMIVAPPRIYLLGGTGASGALATNLYYDITLDAWCPGDACTAGLPDLPAPQTHAAAMRRADGTLVIAGGLDGTTAVASVSWLLPNATQWEGKSSLPAPEGGCAYGVLGERLVCAGGTDTTVLDTNDAYDPDLDQWLELATMPAPRSGTRGAAVGQRLYIPGGGDPAAQPTDTLFIYDALLDTGTSARLGGD